MKMRRAGTEKKEQSEVKRPKERKSMYVHLGESDRDGEKKREGKLRE